MPSPHFSQSVIPLGPGDLIDRAVRFYRRNFLTFVLVAAPPVLMGTAVSVGWTVVARNYFYQGNSGDPFENIGYYIFLWIGSGLIWFTETVATLAVMGGASRNFVRHLLFGEPITFADTYRNLWGRLGALVSASVLITLALVFLCGPILYFGLALGSIVVLISIGVLASVPLLAFIVATVLGLAIGFVTFWLFFLVASRFAYVPQTITVEGLGIFSSIARSASLASGNVTRFAALFTFTTIAIYSALAILYVPLGWYAWYEGIDLLEVFVVDRDLIPAWYQVATQLISQLSLILLSPVWMVGLCLLYVDERVRHEGYDIELMANRRLGEIPEVPEEYVNPLQPALAQHAGDLRRADGPERSTLTTLDLK